MTTEEKQCDMCLSTLLSNKCLSFFKKQIFLEKCGSKSARDIRTIVDFLEKALSKKIIAFLFSINARPNLLSLLACDGKADSSPRLYQFRESLCSTRSLQLLNFFVTDRASNAVPTFDASNNNQTFL